MAVTSSLEKVYEVLDAPVNLLTGDVDDEKQDPVPQPKAAADEEDTEPPQEAHQPQQQSAPTQAEQQQQQEHHEDAAKHGKFLMLSALENLYTEGRKLADTSLEVSKKVWDGRAAVDVQVPRFVLMLGHRSGPRTSVAM